MNAHEWWHAYVKEHGITPGAMEAYNAGMERAAEIVENAEESSSFLYSGKYYANAIRKEIDK